MTVREARGRTEPAIRLIIAYKFAKAAAALGASTVLIVLTAANRTASLNEVAKQLRHHVTSAWSVALANVLVRAIAPAHLWIAASALALDGAFTLLEGWSLQRRWWWGPWLVVAATAGFVPFEVLALLRRVALGRVFLLCVNLIVALYLARRALRRGRRLL